MDGQKDRCTYGWMVRPMDPQLDGHTDYWNDNNDANTFFLFLSINIFLFLLNSLSLPKNIFEEDFGFDLVEALNFNTIRRSFVSIRMLFIILCRSNMYWFWRCIHKISIDKVLHAWPDPYWQITMVTFDNIYHINIQK